MCFLLLHVVFFFDKMEVHADLLEDIDVSHDDSELLFEVIVASTDFFEDEKLIGLSSLFNKLGTTNNSNVFFVLAFLNGQHLSNLTCLWLEERYRKRVNLFESIDVVESDFVSHGYDKLILRLQLKQVCTF